VIPNPGTPSTTVAALVAEINRTHPNLHVVPKPTTGSIVVVSEIQAGEGELGLAQADVVYVAYRKGTPTLPKPHLDLRGIAVGGLNRLYVYVRREGPIQTIRDLRGKRIAIAPVGTAGEVLTRMVLDAYAISENDFVSRVHGIREMGQSFDLEDLDAMIMVGSFDPKTYLSPPKVEDLRLVPIDQETISVLRTKYPFIKPASVKWRDARGDLRNITTVGTDSLVIARREVAEDVVYAVTSAIVNTSSIRNDFSIDLDTAPATPIPLHFGASRFYRELQLSK
jgi:TRAP transporter TAXI family solute receptor